jgi:hypothetical protein
MMADSGNIFDKVSIILSKGIEEKSSSGQWIFRNLMFTYSGDEEDQSFNSGELIEYSTSDGFLSGRAMFLCISQYDREYNPPFKTSVKSKSFFVSNINA